MAPTCEEVPAGGIRSPDATHSELKAAKYLPSSACAALVKENIGEWNNEVGKEHGPDHQEVCEVRYR